MKTNQDQQRDEKKGRHIKKRKTDLTKANNRERKKESANKRKDEDGHPSG